MLDDKYFEVVQHFFNPENSTYFNFSIKISFQVKLKLSEDNSLCEKSLVFSEENSIQEVVGRLWEQSQDML